MQISRWKINSRNRFLGKKNVLAAIYRWLSSKFKIKERVTIMKTIMKAVKNLLKAYFKKNYEMNKSVFDAGLTLC